MEFPKTVTRGSKRKSSKKKRALFIWLLLVLVFVAGIILIRSFYHSNEKHVKKIIHLSKHSIRATGKQKLNEINNAPAMDTYLKSINFNGTAMVVKYGKVLLNKGYGYANFDTQQLNSANSVYYVGSIAKIFISTAIMQLQDKGLVHVTDPLSKYVPDFPNGNQITLFELLTHTSGIPEHSETNEKISHDDLVKKIEKKPLKFTPGTDWYYSDSNYSLLAYIVESVSKQPLETYIQTHIFNVADMKHTGYGHAEGVESFVPTGYKIKNGARVSPSLPDMSELFGCGDIYTTPYDMYLFDKNLYNGKLFMKTDLTPFFTPVKHDYGFGIYRNPGSYSDHGVLPGWNTLNSFSLGGHEYVILFSNIENSGLSLGLIDNHIFGMLNQ